MHKSFIIDKRFDFMHVVIEITNQYLPNLNLVYMT